jgi:hypothetical protein
LQLEAKQADEEDFEQLTRQVEDKGKGARGLNIYPTYFTVSVTHPPCLCPLSTHTLAGFFMPGDRVEYDD